MSIFKKSKTEEVSPETIHVSTPPMPPCESPKKELPEPPFNATAARSYANWKREDAIETIRDKIWREIADEVKKGGVSTIVTLPVHPRPSIFSYTDVERACQLLSKYLFNIVKVMAEDFVKNGYQMTITNDIYSEKYCAEASKKVGVYINSAHDLDTIRIEISWEEPESVQEPYLKIIDYSGALIKKMDKDNTEYYIRPKRIVVKTKGELENGDKSD